jgi:hemin uptake protein HemP
MPMRMIIICAGPLPGTKLMNTPPTAVTRPVTRDLETRELGTPCLRSDELFGKQREILIQHAGSFYRLRMTHSNKLILTK